MKFRFLTLICILLLIGACRKADVMNRVPSDLLTKEQMIPLLVDIHLTEAALKLNPSGVKPNEIKSYYSSAYLPVFNKYKTSPEQFNRSLQWYTRHIAQLDDIYTEVITRLSKLQTLLKVKQMRAPAKKFPQPVTPAKKISRLVSPPPKK